MIGVAIVGCGRVAREVHLPLLARRRDVRVVGVADPNPRALDAAAELAPNAVRVADWRALLELDRCDAIFVTSPPATHAPIALAALAGGRHVYLEKPMATTPEDARAIEQAWRASGRVVMVGFNYRFNPRHVAARRQIASGAIGRVTGIRTTFSTSNGPQGAWDRSAATGGGVLSELGSHHLDLVAYLAGQSIAQIVSAAGNEDALTLEARLADDTPVAMHVARRAANVDRIEIDGTRGRLVIDRYHVAPWQLGYALARRRSPWHEPSHSAALDAFVAAVDGSTAPIPTPADGRAVVDLVASAQSHVPIQRADDSASVVISTDAPELSIVLLVADRYACVRAAVRNLKRQTTDARLELILVAPSADALEMTDQDRADVAAFASSQILEVGRLQISGVARAAGISAARAPYAVLAEDHSFPRPGWARALIAAFDHEWAAVGPSVTNGNPGTLMSWANLFIHYGPWLAPARAGEWPLIPGHNSAYRRESVLRFGERLGPLMEAETVLHWELRGAGETIGLAPDAKVAHMNMSVIGESMRESFYWGRLFASNRSKTAPVSRRAIFALGSPLIAPLRFARAGRDAMRIGRTGTFVLSSPLVAALVILDAVGQLIGYAVPALGGTVAYLTDREFHRERFMREQPSS